MVTMYLWMQEQINKNTKNTQDFSAYLFIFFVKIYCIMGENVVLLYSYDYWVRLCALIDLEEDYHVI